MQAQQVFHIYNLPRELLDTLTLRILLSEPPPPTNTKSTLIFNPSEDSRQIQDGFDGAVISGAGIGARACNICLGATFSDVDEQRTHFRSDWHRYNVKTRLSGGQAVSEENFGQLVEALDDSLSGSASSSSEDESSGDGSSDAVNALISKTKRLNAQLNSATDDALVDQKHVPQSPFAWFHSPQHQTQLGVYKSIFPSFIESDAYLQELKDMQMGGPEGRTWAMFMVAGGHFAGAIVKVGKSDEERAEEVEEAVTAASGKKKKLKKPKPETEVLRHKTFHRYTTRRKQGGSQSVNDNAKGPAKSAGALLRRYGEQALREDIRNLLLDWAEDIDACERIWIRASTSNRRIFLDFEGPIAKGDIRLRTFPFPTRRPTQSELARCLLELTRPKVSHFTEDELRQQDEAYLASIKPKPPNPAPTPAPQPLVQPLIPPKLKLTKEQEVLKDKWLRAFDMMSRDRLEALKSFWDRESDALGGINALVPEFVSVDASGNMKKAGTLLQAAVVAGSEDIVKWLLEEKDADPTIPVPSTVPLKPGASRAAYDLARSKAIRDIFRRCAAIYLDKWDWLGAARVPSGLSKEMEEERDEKKKVRRKGLKEKVKEREREAAAKKAAAGIVDSEPELEPAPMPRLENPAGPRRLGGFSGTSDGVAGLTPEMRARVERERRARAAEARLKAL
ncbi:Protein VMS1 [Leucoagaricus sp. SymC.cos]|nr:Protein VMS1 [Leucoagaricus sp. SymC.cos]